jgi:hypothetical protein
MAQAAHGERAERGWIVLVLVLVLDKFRLF